PCRRPRSGRPPRRVEAMRQPSQGGPLPLAGDTLQIVTAAVLEFETRPDYEVPDRTRHEHLAGTGQCRDARADVHRHPREVLTSHLTFTRVQAGPDVDTNAARPARVRLPASGRASLALRPR